MSDDRWLRGSSGKQGGERRGGLQRAVRTLAYLLRRDAVALMMRADDNERITLPNLLRRNAVALEAALLIEFRHLPGVRILLCVTVCVAVVWWLGLNS